MKKLIGLLTLLAVPFLVKSMDTAVGRASQLMDIIQKQKNGWLDYKKDKFNAKIDLIKSEHNKMFEMKKKNLQQLPQTKENIAVVESAIKDELAFHKQNLADWKNLTEQQSQKARDLGIANQKELDSFEASATGAATPATPMLPEAEQAAGE